MHRSRQIALILVLAVAAVLVTAPWASGKSKTEKLRGVVTQEHNNIHTNTTTITIALRSGGKPRGKITFPGCQGTGTSVICGGKMKLKGLGSGLSVLFTWGCAQVKPFKCAKSATSFIDNKSAKNLGSITIKTGPPQKGHAALKKGEHFPVTVKLT
jgi:hypothetical protein